MSQIIEDLETFCIEEGVEDINDLIGTLKT
jgi:hypothetical protein